jgi:glycosyltransferase involved in cell wall biosynthesis
MNSVGKPLVSFVIPVLNGERDISRCLGSIKRLHFPSEAYEVIVIDNGSTDRTRYIVRELGFNCMVVPNVHVSVLRNRGAAIAHGDYLAFVDADMELTPDWLQNGLSVFTDQQVVVSGCFPDIPKDATWVQRAWSIHRRGRLSESHPTPVRWLGSANLIVRRAAFLAVRGFNEQLETTEDVDLCYRLGQCGTIVHNLAMEAIHWGEDPDLKTFWRKEVWRGIGSLKGALLHGLRWDEAPSLGYPLYMLCGVLFFILGSIVDLWHGQFFFVPLSLALLIIPALGLALNTVCLTRQPRLTLQLFLLYFIYGLARAYAVMKPWTTSLSSPNVS